MTPHRQTPHLIRTEDLVGTLPCFFYLMMMIMMMTAMMIMLVIVTEGNFFHLFEDAYKMSHVQMGVIIHLHNEPESM